jgi:DNA mismatch endonuclease (patch repair protein)
MKANRATDTKPEIDLRSALWRMGRRGFRKNVKSLPGKPDIVYHRKRLAIFVHGCFWHGCMTCTRNLTPTKNAEFWADKISKTKIRDDRNVELLEAMGYRVVIAWECDISSDLDRVIGKIDKILSAPEAGAL